jgi:SAM-dependent MidA family methyltransferase
MTALADKIIRLIGAVGPISVADYMSLVLSDPDHGYYTTRTAIGLEGDFITAPEISQMFGELIGIWCVAAYEALGRPPRLSLIELGPGRGTLMADLLRAGRVDPGFIRAAGRPPASRASPAPSGTTGSTTCRTDRSWWSPTSSSMPCRSASSS